jgi:hypothetical protein
MIIRDIKQFTELTDAQNKTGIVLLPMGLSVN